MRLPRLPTNRLSRFSLAIAAMAVLLYGAIWVNQLRGNTRQYRIGLFTTLPILWNENADIADLLRQDQPGPHWAKGELEQRGRIVPLDMLAGSMGSAPLEQVDVLVLAQPRPLSPDENVALDSWVRSGGRLLLLADPALTQESGYGLGDPRRPQAVALLSPILRHWDLDLEFDDAQQFGERLVDVMGMAVPVNLPGRFATRGQPGCRLWGEDVVVTCKIGKGRLVALADAAVLEPDDPDGSRRKAFAWLLEATAVAR